MIFPLAALYGWLLSAPCDDAYIFFVYAKNFVEGNGLTYNGTYVEGFSSLLWTTLLAIVGLTRVNLPTLGVMLSVASGLLTLAMTFRLGRRLSLDTRWALLPVVLLAATGDFAFYMSVGLEECLFAVLVAYCVGEAHKPDPATTLRFSRLSVDAGINGFNSSRRGHDRWPVGGVIGNLFTVMAVAREVHDRSYSHAGPGYGGEVELLWILAS